MAKPSKAQRILTHGQVWTALDRLAERRCEVEVDPAASEVDRLPQE